jgi:hypothetical protein
VRCLDADRCDTEILTAESAAVKEDMRSDTAAARSGSGQRAGHQRIVNPI